MNLDGPPLLYTLDENKEPQPCEDPLEWQMWFGEIENRKVEYTLIGSAEGKVTRISTIFMGVDHGFAQPGFRPVLWETMVFDDDGEILGQHRYCSHEEAVEGHKDVVESWKIAEQTES